MKWKVCLCRDKIVHFYFFFNSCALVIFNQKNELLLLASTSIWWHASAWGQNNHSCPSATCHSHEITAIIKQQRSNQFRWTFSCLRSRCAWMSVSGRKDSCYLGYVVIKKKHNRISLTVMLLFFWFHLFSVKFHIGCPHTRHCYAYFIMCLIRNHRKLLYFVFV